MTKRFSLVPECNVFLQCCITRVPVCYFSYKLPGCKIITDSDLQVQNYKNEGQLKLKLQQLWAIAL